MNHKILALALLTASSSAFAAQGDLWLNIHFASKHSDDGYYDRTVDWSDYPNNEIAYREFNEVNPGIGLIYEVEDFLDVRGGIYKNSVHKNTVYAGGSIHSSFTNLVSVGLMVGIASGYEAATELLITPMAMPYLALNTEYVRLEVTYLPAIADRASVVGFSTSVKF